MLISGDRVAALLGRVLRPSEAPTGQPDNREQPELRLAKGGNDARTESDETEGR